MQQSKLSWKLYEDTRPITLKSSIRLLSLTVHNIRLHLKLLIEFLGYAFYFIVLNFDNFAFLFIASRMFYMLFNIVKPFLSQRYLYFLLLIINWNLSMLSSHVHDYLNPLLVIFKMSALPLEHLPKWVSSQPSLTLGLLHSWQTQMQTSFRYISGGQEQEQSMQWRYGKLTFVSACPVTK